MLASGSAIRSRMFFRFRLAARAVAESKQCAEPLMCAAVPPMLAMARLCSKLRAAKPRLAGAGVVEVSVIRFPVMG